MNGNSLNFAINEIFMVNSFSDRFKLSIYLIPITTIDGLFITVLNAIDDREFVWLLRLSLTILRYVSRLLVTLCLII